MTVIEMNKKDKDWTGSNTWVIKGHDIWEAVDGQYFQSAVPYSMKFYLEIQVKERLQNT